MMQSSAFFPYFEDPLILDYGTWEQQTEYSGGGGMGTVGFSFGDFSTQIALPSGGGTVSQPDVKVTLTGIANSAEQALQANLGAWQSGQISAETAQDQAWRILNDAMQRMMQFGPQGYQSAAERDRRIDPTRLRWDWIAYYIDPIYVAETGQPAPAGAGAGVPGIPPSGAAIAGFGGSNGLLVLLAGTALLVLVLRRRGS